MSQKKVITPDLNQLEAITGTPKPTGAEIIRAAAILGKKENAVAVIVKSPHFSVSSYGYSGRAVLINTTVERDFSPHDKLISPEQITAPGNTFAVLKPNVADSYIQP